MRLMVAVLDVQCCCFIWIENWHGDWYPSVASFMFAQCWHQGFVLESKSSWFCGDKKTVREDNVIVRLLLTL